MTSMRPYVHPKHRLFNSGGRSDHLFIHHVSQLLFQYILPFGTQILNNSHRVIGQVWAASTCSQQGKNVCV